MHGTLDRSLPISIERFALVRAHRWLKRAINCPLLGDFIRAAPEANRNACEVGCSKRCCLRNLWSLHWYAQNVGLELHQEIVHHSSAVYTQCLQVYFTIGDHCFKHIT